MSMSTWDEYLREKVTGPVLRSAGRHYPSVQTASDCMDWIESQGLVIVGFDGLHAVAQGMHPSLDHIADFSSIERDWDAQVAATAAASRDLLVAGSATSSSSISTSSNATAVSNATAIDIRLVGD